MDKSNMWAIIGEGAEDGIWSVYLNGSNFPMVCLQTDLIDRLKASADELSKKSGKKYKLTHYIAVN